MTERQTETEKHGGRETDREANRKTEKTGIRTEKQTEKTWTPKNLYKYREIKDTHVSKTQSLATCPIPPHFVHTIWLVTFCTVHSQ